MEEQTERPKGKRAFDGRRYMVVVDGSDEFEKALIHAVRLVMANRGHLILSCTYDIEGAMTWGRVETMLSKELRENAEREVWEIAKKVQDKYKITPCVVIEHGDAKEVITKIASKEVGADVLVLAAGTSSPGPLLSYLTSKALGRLNIPLVMVPGHLTIEEIERL